MDMDNEKLIKILMLNPNGRRVVSEMAAQVVAAAIVHERTEDEILAIMNFFIKAEIEEHREINQKLVELNKIIKELFDGPDIK